MCCVCSLVWGYGIQGIIYSIYHGSALKFCEANAISITLMAGGEGIYCRSAIQRLARDPLPAAGTSGEHVTGTRATTPPHGARGVPSLPTYARIRVHYLIACKPLVQTATPAATGDRLQDRVPRILTDILTTHPPTPGTLGVTAHEWPATGFLQTTDRNPGIGVYDYRQTGTRI